MIYRSTADVIQDLEQAGQLKRISQELDPYLEIPEIQRRVYAAQGPALLFERVAGSPFPALGNVFGTMDRCRFLFRDTLKTVEWLIQSKADPLQVLKSPGRWFKLPGMGLNALPRKHRRGPVMECSTTLDQLPAIHSWPEDGGPFITLPQVCTLDVQKPSILTSNLGMYRIQLSGNDYIPNQECGMHYQIHRGIGVHHHAAIQAGVPLKVSIFVGGPPAHAFSAVMPLPEGLSETVFAGVLAGTPFRYALQDGWVISLDADFCILGEVAADLKPEGPFGDHLGFYSLKHDFPYLKVHRVYHRKNAVWPFTVVGRPPQEDTTFGEMIHEMTGAMVPASVPGLHEVHAVDAAGVHPLTFAIGSERYVPWEQREPMEILTQANALLGFNQISLTKYLWIAAYEDDPSLSTHTVEAFLIHMLCRIQLRRDLHFQTSTTMDTLDYSGGTINHGSKIVIAAAGEPCRTLNRSLEEGVPFPQMSQTLAQPRQVRVVMPGVLVVEVRSWQDQETAEQERAQFCEALAQWPERDHWPLITWVDDAEFSARNLDHWLWTTFVRSNPSHDISGCREQTAQKHWSCEAPLVIDARAKKHHTSPLMEDPLISRQVDALFRSGGILADCNP